MIKSILIGIIYSLTLLLSGWVRVLFSMLSISLGRQTPMLYLFMGFSFGIGTPFNSLPFWPGFLTGLILVFGIMQWASGIAIKTGVQNTVSESCAGFFIGSFIGFILGLF
jgi:ABC-type amino acid transport system permease subunit